MVVPIQHVEGSIRHYYGIGTIKYSRADRRRRYVLGLFSNIFKASRTCLDDAQPDVGAQLRVIEAKLKLLSFVGVEVVRLECFRRAAGQDCAAVVVVVE